LQRKSFHIITLGCKVNQYESEALRQAWLKAGHRELTSPLGADLILINSCAITSKAISDLRAVSRRARRLAPRGEILVTGCAAEAFPHELSPLPVDALVPQRKKTTLLRRLDADEPANDFRNHDDPEGVVHNSDDPEVVVHNHDDQEGAVQATAFPDFSISDYGRSRAVLKIHDGCSQHCTYCIVPSGRGPSVSRPWPAVLAEAGRLANAGFREIILNGVNLRQYGSDLPGKPDFWDLLTRLTDAFAPEWGGGGQEERQALRFRISSLEPGQLNLKALDTLAKSRLVAPHLHLSLQSGSVSILRKMGRRHYNVRILPDFSDSLKQIWPKFALGADFIVGFPGETENDFTDTLELCAQLPLTYAHVFPYSRRPGTTAAKLPGQVSQEVKKERAARLRELISRKKQEFLQGQLQLDRVWVIPEEGKKGRGINEFYSACRFGGTDFPQGKNILPARPVAVEKETLLVQL
jgi:MiaB/RimO family radical SAM methylthiotransferase